MKTSWVILVLVLAGAAAWFVFGQRHSGPPPEIAALEMMRGDISETPSCFTLASVLKANRLDGSASDVGVVWTNRVRDEWAMRVARGKSWSSYRFIKQGNFLVPVLSSSSDDLPQLGLEKAIDELLVATANGSVPKVARCSGN
jgi:hypothetical protein